MRRGELPLHRVYLGASGEDAVRGGPLQAVAPLPPHQGLVEQAGKGDDPWSDMYIVRTNERSLKFVIFASLCCKSVCWTFYFVMYFATI